MAASLAMKIAQFDDMPQPIQLVLICPVIDCTATESTIWSTALYSPWLTPARMSWYQDMYFPAGADRSHWHASPCFANHDLLAKNPRSWIGVAECDLLAPEGKQYADILRGAGINVELKEYKGATHSILVLAG